MNINHHKAVTAPIIKGPCGFFNFKKLMHTKTLLLAGLFTGICASCSQHSCKIEGTVENAKDGDTLYIARMTDGTFLPTDTVLLTDGKFSMKVACDSTVIASYYYQDKQNHEIYSNIFFMENGNVKLGISSNGKVSGTECNDIYQQLMDSVYAIHAQMSKIYSEHALTDSTMEFTPDPETEEQLIALDRQSNELVKENVKAHINKPVGYFLFLSCYNMFTPAEILELADQVAPNYKNSSTINYIKEEAQRGMNLASGQSFADIALPAIDGSNLRLADIIKNNKLTLVDCWASWCGPCRKEMPNVVALYKKYHEKGLEIIGISFDEDENEWKQAVEEMNMTWPQVSELQSWDNIMTRQYGVTSIPYTILIDSNGTIIGQQLRGKELEDKVKEYLD